MSSSVRRAGIAHEADGSEVIWSVADGRRGRRWRAVVRRGGAISGSLLLEVDPDGRPARLELATGEGLLTLHPEPPGSLHGNVVTAGGIRHLTLAWSENHAIEVDPLAVSDAITVRRLAGSTAVGEGRTVPVVVVGVDLSIREAARRFARLAEASWQIERDGTLAALAIDDDGLPAWPVAGEWPLELDPQP